MSYSIYIGESVVDECEPGDAITLRVNETSHDNAPSFPGDFMTRNTNNRNPGYSQWAEFCRAVGLCDLFFDDESGLMREHPGCFRLGHVHLECVEKALEKWEREHSGKVPGWDPNVDAFNESKADPKYDGNMARLLWLRWWVRWALENCKVPAIYNS